MPVGLLRFTTGSFQAPLSFFLGGDDGRFITAPVPAYLVRHDAKGLAIFDTGLHHRFRREIDARLAPDQIGFDFVEGQELAARMRAAGVDPGEVRWVINSHLHVDHCGGNDGFPNATVVVQRRELEVARAKADGGLYSVDDFETGQPFLRIDGEHDLFGDGSLVLFPTRGHTPGHQSARVRLVSGDVILTSDCCYLARNLETLTPSPADADADASREVLRRLLHLREGGARLLFGHDPDQWRGVAQGERMS